MPWEDKSMILMTADKPHGRINIWALHPAAQKATAIFVYQVKPSYLGKSTLPHSDERTVLLPN